MPCAVAPGQAAAGLLRSVLLWVFCSLLRSVQLWVFCMDYPVFLGSVLWLLVRLVQ